MKSFPSTTALLLFALIIWHLHLSSACTNLLITPGASTDGSAMIAYNADSPTLMGVLYHYPPSENAESPRKIYDWDSGRYLGEVDLNEFFKHSAVTYNVVGNANEHGLVIAETTFGGIPLLAWNQTGALIDYGSLIYLTLQRAKTCRQAISVMTGLLDTFGYASGGESFSIADASGEVWMMEIISRGNDYGKLGAVWVAVKIPDGSVAAHANHARITTFDRNDSNNYMYAEDVVDVAIFYGIYPADANPLSFSFSDVYDPRNFLNVRQGEARVWSLFSPIADEDGAFQTKHIAYAMGNDLSQRMPLYITPYRKLSLLDAMSLMSSHYEGTVLDASVDVGSGLFASPYRPRPLVWTHDNHTYHNERSIATAKTGWNFIATIRPWMPPPLATILWFACDDSSTAPRVPIYASTRRVPSPYAGKGSQDGVVSPLLQFDLNKAFWVQNMVSNFVYSRWSDAYPMLQQRIHQLTKRFMDKVAYTDKETQRIYANKGSVAAVEYMTTASVKFGNVMHKEWMQFYGELFVRFRDFYTITAMDDEPVCNCVAKEPGMSDIVKERIVKETGEHYRVVENVVLEHSLWNGLDLENLDAYRSVQ
jgi:dipeptidase